MKKIGWIFGWFPLVGIIIYYYQASPKTPTVVGDKKAERASISKKMSESSQQKWAEYRSAQEKSNAEKREKLDANFQKLLDDTAELAKTLTPERQRILVDATLKAREPRYRSLLDTWNLDSATVNQVFQVIRARDAELEALRAENFRNGSPSIYEYQAKLKVTSANATKQLAGILGQNRTAALGRLEVQMNPSLASQTTALGND